MKPLDDPHLQIFAVAGEAIAHRVEHGAPPAAPPDPEAAAVLAGFLDAAAGRPFRLVVGRDDRALALAYARGRDGCHELGLVGLDEALRDLPEEGSSRDGAVTKRDP